MSIEGFRELDGIVQWLRRLLQLGSASKEHFLADDFLTTMNCLTGVFAKDNVEGQPSSGMHASNPVGAEASNHGGKNAEEHALVPIVPNNTTNFRSSYSDKNTGMEIAKKRATNSPIDHVGIGIPDDENDSDENEKKMKGRHGFVLNTAIASLPCLGFLIPYWTFFCSNANFDTWKDIIPTGHLVLTIISLILIGPASSFKEGALRDSFGFKLLQIAQLLILLWLCSASFITLHVCRDISKSVVWPSACAVLCMTVIIWMNYFQPAEMVIKRIKTMFKKATQWLGNLSLPECITAKFKKVQGTQLRSQSQPMDTA
ncbi:uncharacterized protein LOC123452467 [Hordeum vulgare subsp. vulgare]|uniref:uncharacterized protein LOC123452467 n=1 Tax=Hordeum vulgare subsp. vulgare TaxID=112509 RepID=UPI001D1A4790|nr:uncharacterized protein LOC123452467 [Hordeum vulgare subsp. vulgare]